MYKKYYAYINKKIFSPKISKIKNGHSLESWKPNGIIRIPLDLLELWGNFGCWKYWEGLKLKK